MSIAAKLNVRDLAPIDVHSRLKNKVLFGSDYPHITPDRWIADFEKIEIREEVKPLILKENAVKLLRLDGA